MRETIFLYKFSTSMRYAWVALPVPLRVQRKGFSISIFNAIDESTIKEMTMKPDMAIAHHRC